MGLRTFDKNVHRIYITILTLGTAYGVSIALTGLLLDKEGFSKDQIGTLATFFAGGIVGLSLPMGSILRKVGAKRAIAGAILIYAACVGVFPLLHDYWAVASVRAIDGASSVAIWVGCETVLLAKAPKAEKAFAMSLYAIAMASGYILGAAGAKGIVWIGETQHLAALDAMRTAFFVAAGIAVISATYVVLRLDGAIDVSHIDEPDADDATRSEPRVPVSAGAILSKIKTSAFATFAYGYFQSAVVLFLPLYLKSERSVPEEDTILITVYFAGGMLLVSNFAGRVGDRYGHLAVMRVLAVIGGVMIASFVWLPNFKWMCAAIFVAGATFASISPISLALQGLVTPRGELARGNSFYNAFYALGMLFGPPISGRIFSKYGGATMLASLTGLWAAFVVFTIAFRGDDPSHHKTLAKPAPIPAE